MYKSNSELIFQIPKFNDDFQPKLDRSMSVETQKSQFKIYNNKNSFLSSIFTLNFNPPQQKYNINQNNNNNNNESNKKKKHTLYDSFNDFLRPSYNIITPLNVMKASESTSNSTQQIQNTTTYEIKNNGGLNNLSNKPLDEIIERGNDKSTSINLKETFHFQNNVDLVQQGTKTSSMSVIHAEKTLNGDCLKFFTGIEMLKNVSSLEFSSASENSAFSKELFSKVKEIENLMITKEFLSITKKGESKWEVLKPQIFKLIISFKKEKKSFVESTIDVSQNLKIDEDSPEIIIREILKDKVRPSLFSDGADVEFISLNDSQLTLSLKGSYKNFPSVQDSLKNLVFEYSSIWVPIKSILFV